ncbi:hypothetical protein [Endozoicomonas sp. ALC020]|uniref:hypothetical protein n=1 Tax=Endozoicomonas sp. ALC020 TaxID=3403077 RepID=UPI003BAED109
MTNARPRALTLAVAIAIGSSIMATQALATRRLQTKFVGIQDNGQVQLYRSNVIVKPTLDDNQQPIPKSFTTTYPDMSHFSDDYIFPTFIGVLPGINEGVSIVDLFETDKNSVAQKYTRTLKVGDEGVFRFTHNLEEEELVIEVRAGMTDRDSVAAVLEQMEGFESLEPLTKTASPYILDEVLVAAGNRAGKLGTSDHYVALATIEVDKVAVNGRTFMRLVAAGDSPPDLQRLGQSLFVNDDVLLAAATSAYFQVHVLERDIQQQALNELLAHSKPVGYVVHVEDDTRAYPVPVGYPKLEVTEAPGEVIVFKSYSQYPTNVAFIETLLKFWREADGKNLPDAIKAQVKSYETRYYQYIIRSRQMAVLEEMAAKYEHHDGEFSRYPMAMLAYYEYLQQALTSATPDSASQFEFALEQITAASSVITSSWLHFQLEKHFGFKPVLKNLLADHLSFWTLIPVVNVINKEQLDIPGDDPFATKVISDMARQLPEMYNLMEELHIKEAKILEINNELQHAVDTQVAGVKEKFEALEIKVRINDELEKLRFKLASLKDQEQKLRQESKRLPALEQQFHNARNVYNSEKAAKLGIGDWDDSLPLEEQTRRIIERINDIFAAVVATEPRQQETVEPSLAAEAEKIAATKARFATLAEHLNIQDFDGNADIDVQLECLLDKIETMAAQQKSLLQIVETLNDQLDIENSYTRARKAALVAVSGIELSEDSTPEDRKTLESRVNFELHRLAELEAELQDIITPGHPRARPEVLETLRSVENVLEINDVDENDGEYLRRDAISEKIQTYIAETSQRAEQQALVALKTAEEILKINVNEADDKAIRLERVCTKLDNNGVSQATLDTIEQTLCKEDITPADQRDLQREKLHRRLTFHVQEPDRQARRQQKKLLIAIEEKLQVDSVVKNEAIEKGKAFLARLANDLGVKYENDAHMTYNKYQISEKIMALMDEVDEAYVHGDVRRNRNNEIAHQLNIDDYKDDATIEDQNVLISKKLQQLDQKVYQAGFAEVNEHITAIENELDRQMARLGPKPRHVLDRAVARAEQAVEKAKSELGSAYQKWDAIDVTQLLLSLNPVVRQGILDEEKEALNQAIKQLQVEWGQTTSDEQTLEERAKDFKHFLLERKKTVKHFLRSFKGSRDEIAQKVKARIDHETQTTDDTILLKQAYSSIHSDSNYRDRIIHKAIDEIDEVFDEQSLIRKKYDDVTVFLNEHDRKSMELTNARLEEGNAQEGLVAKRQEIIHSGDMDPGSALKQKSEAVSKAEVALTDYHKTALETVEEAVGLKPDATAPLEQRIDALRNRQLQLGNENVISGKVWQLIQKRASLNDEIATRKADIERAKAALEAARKAVKNQGGPFQYTPKQAKVLDAIQTFTWQQPLKRQALQAAMGLAVINDKTIPHLPDFNFDDELAPIHLQTLVGDLTFKQASRIVEVFKALKRDYLPSPSQPAEDQPMNILEEVQNLVHRAKHEMETGAPEYDDDIYAIGLASIHFVEREPEDLKSSFSEYFATHSATGNKIIALLREGLISQVELENYFKAIRGAYGYQTVAEFEHFLGYKHGVNVPHFKDAVQMLSDTAAREFMRDAFTPVTATGPVAMKASVADMTEYAAAVIANYVLDDIAFDNGRRTAAFLTSVKDTLTPYANAAGISESELIRVIHGTLKQAHAAAVEQQLNDYWVKPSAALVQAFTWYFSSYKPLLVAHNAWQANLLSLSNMSLLYLLDLTNRGDYLHRMLTPFQHWLQHYGIDLDRTFQYSEHNDIEQVSEVAGLTMPLGKAASSVILLRTGSMLFARQYNANPLMYRSLSRLVPEIVKSMGSGQGFQVPLLNRVTPQKVKTLASATAGLVLGPVATVGAYVHGLVSGFTYAQTFGFALASSLTYDFFMNDNKMLTQWLGGPLGRSLDRINRWRGVGETQDDYVKRTAIATPQRYVETDEEYASRVKANNTMYGWTLHENYLQFRERRDRTMKLFENGWEKYFREKVPKWSFSHAESIPYSYTLGAFYEQQQGDDQKVQGHDKRNAPQSSFPLAAPADHPD